jgi:hypothetical protein
MASIIRAKDEIVNWFNRTTDMSLNNRNCLHNQSALLYGFLEATCGEGGGDQSPAASKRVSTCL